MGRIGVDIYPLQTGRSLRHVETFGKYLGGSPTNVAVAAARYGRRAAVISRTGQDPFGDYIHDALRGFGVDDRFVTAVPSLPTPVTFCEIFPPDDFPLYFYRYPTAPDLQIERSELDLEAIAAAGIFWMTGTGLCQEPSRSATLRALEARSRARRARPSSTWTTGRCSGRPGPRRGGGTARRCRTPRSRSATWTSATPRSAYGNPGRPPGPCTTRASSSRSSSRDRPACWPRTARRSCRCRRSRSRSLTGWVRAMRSAAPCATRWLSGWDLERVLRFCNAAGAIVASRLACADAMPTADEVEATMRGLLSKGTQRA